MPLSMREAVPDDRLVSRKLKVFDTIEVAHTHYLPGEMEVPPLQGHAVNLHLGGEGRVLTRIDGRTWERERTPGAVEIFAGGRSQEWVLEGTVSEDMNVLLDEGLVARVAQEAVAEPDQVELVDDLYASDPRVEHILRLLLSELGGGGLGGELYVQSLATALAVQLLREHSPPSLEAPLTGGTSERGPRNTLPPRTLRAATDYVEEHLAGELSLPAIAAVANLSERHFSRVFKESTGLSPHRYVITRRVERAKGLLADTDLSVGEVARACGFSHQGHLARHFVRLVGTSPVRFRRETRR